MAVGYLAAPLAGDRRVLEAGSLLVRTAGNVGAVEIVEIVVVAVVVVLGGEVAAADDGALAAVAVVPLGNGRQPQQARRRQRQVWQQQWLERGWIRQGTDLVAVRPTWW